MRNALTTISRFTIAWVFAVLMVPMMVRFAPGFTVVFLVYNVAGMVYLLLTKTGGRKHVARDL
jgi:hypothetical protein